MNIWIAFITGLTAGGLSCLAVQGGLLASSLAVQLEQDLQQGGKNGQRSHQIARPILFFLLAKLTAYTLLGFLLGLLGSVLQLTPMIRAVLLIAIGIFMVGNGLRMLNVHPIFRYFAIQPPAKFTRYLRRKAKGGNASTISAVFLGALTVLIPCGVTQSMMALAIGTGNPWEGAAILSAFILGTSPVFFAAFYFAAKLGAKLERAFMTIVAVVVLILGLVSIESGLVLSGSPISFSRLTRPLFAQQASEETPLPTPNISPLLNPPGVDPAYTPTPAPDGVITLNVLNSGYSPNSQVVPANQDLELHLITQKTYSCARAFVIPDLNVEVMLPETGDVAVEIPAQPAGTVLRYACSMGMYSGELVFE